MSGGMGWIKRIASGLRQSTTRLVDGVAGVFTGGQLDDDKLSALEEVLLQADLGPQTTMRLCAQLRTQRFGKDMDAQEVRRFLAREIAALMQPCEQALDFAERNSEGVLILLLMGANGSGKTTTIGKLAALYAGTGARVMVAAGDRFRAAADEQLQIWAARAQAEIVTGAPGGDAAALVHDAITRAQTCGADILLVDTAGRLHNKANLMAELAKIDRIITKKAPGQPRHRILVLDAGIGQNAVNQARQFGEIVPITGIIMTKLDGSAKGGTLVPIAESLGYAVHMVGLGEGLDDLQPFSAQAYAYALLGLEVP